MSELAGDNIFLSIWGKGSRIRLRPPGFCYKMLTFQAQKFEKIAIL